MTYLAKPRLHHPTLTHNKVGYTRRDYEGRISTLCAGCGHDSISAAIIQACWELDIEPHRVAKLSGIGCSSRIPAYTTCYGFHGVHGRALAAGTGLKVARPDLTVVVTGGDGDGYSIGGNHFMHACRRNVDMTYIVMDNEVYGMTKGQASPTTEPDWDNKLAPGGTGIRPLDSMGRGRVVAYDVPIRCGDVLVNPGDVVFADFDGVVVVPWQIEAQVFELAAAKAHKETDSRRDLLAQAGYANHEKLIEIIGKNRQELHTFQQRQRVIQRFFQDAVVELQHAQLAIDVQTRIAEIDGLAHRFRKLGQYLVLLNHGSQPVWVQSSMLYGV